MSLAFNTLLSLIIVAVAAAAILGRQAFMAVVFFIAYGLLIALAWLRLEATNVALAEAAIGAGLTGILLLAVAGEDWAMLDVAIVLALLAAVSIIAFAKSVRRVGTGDPEDDDHHD